jgi:hypothetical protein
MHIAIWIFVALCLSLWSLAAWGLHKLLAMSAATGPGWVDELVAAAGQMPYRELIERWVPGWQDLLRLGLETTQQILAWLAHTAPWALWAVWGVGVVCALGAGALLSLVVVLLKPKTKSIAPLTPSA